jgi:hypothetical protein
MATMAAAASQTSTGVRCMSAGQRFRFRRKLTAALLRVLKVVADMERRGTVAKCENLVAAETAVTVLAAFLRRGPAAAGDPLVIVPAADKAAVKRAAVRRVTETHKRRRRRGYRNRGRQPARAIGPVPVGRDVEPAPRPVTQGDQP